jgi:hypothetical protein
MAQRFSKATFVAEIESIMEKIRERNGFDAGDGWAQVLHGKQRGANTLRAVEYGRFSMLQDLLEEFAS